MAEIEIYEYIASIKAERDALERRLKHLLRSKTIRAYDQLKWQSGEYERDIDELDAYIEKLESERAACDSTQQINGN